GRDVTDEAFRRISGGEAREISLSHAAGNTDSFVNTWGIRTELCRLYGYLPAACSTARGLLASFSGSFPHR
ncbi:MAG TPA: hypothetical protein VI055_15590, partial [Rubrobacter sp.]